MLELLQVMRKDLKKTAITKGVNPHLLRHTYATQLLEEGGIVTLKELLGRFDIIKPIIYLYVMQCELVKPYSPLDSLCHRREK